MQVRDAREEDAAAACDVVRRSITDLCREDHRGDASTLSQWLANKTPENMCRWIAGPGGHVLLATDGDVVLGVGALQGSGKVTLNYVAPEARFRGVSKAVLAALEAKAAALGAAACTLESTAVARRFYLACGYQEAGPPVPGYGIGFGYPMAKRLRT
jgi:GNAT superfamily N-acetyltransferase